MSKRLTPEREAEIRRNIAMGSKTSGDLWCAELLAEIEALRLQVDAGIVEFMQLRDKYIRELDAVRGGT